MESIEGIEGSEKFVAKHAQSEGYRLDSREKKSPPICHQTKPNQTKPNQYLVPGDTCRLSQNGGHLLGFSLVPSSET
jgi:hypothetical protein